MNSIKSLKIFNIILLICLNQFVSAQNAPKTIVLDGVALERNKKTFAQGKDVTKNAALKSFLAQADKIVKKGKFYSVMDKTIVPPSGDKHDYMSQAPYWWADSSKPKGLPYIRRDGERNPELSKISDHEEMGELMNDAEMTALAYYFSKNEKYAIHTAKLLKTWFLDKATRQTPHLNFGQGIPGINTGRGIGIIETRDLYRVADAAILLRGSKNWTKENEIGLKKWFSDFLTWLIESPIGKDEADEHNNHGTYYDVQIVAYALFTDKPAIAKIQLDTTKQRMLRQLKPDGSQPFELVRTVSWGYTNMNLYGFITLARLAEHVKIDLWHYETADGKSIQKCIDWLIPYLKKEKEWTFKQIKKITYEETVRNLLAAAKSYPTAHYNNLAQETDKEIYNSPIYQLIF